MTLLGENSRGMWHEACCLGLIRNLMHMLKESCCKKHNEEKEE